jgi:hypothetical protein
VSLLGRLLGSLLEVLDVLLRIGLRSVSLDGLLAVRGELGLPVAAALLLLLEGVLLVLFVVDVGFCGGGSVRMGFTLVVPSIGLRDINLRVEDSLRPRRVDVVKNPRPRIILLACAARIVIMDRADIILAVVVWEVKELSVIISKDWRELMRGRK